MSNITKSNTSKRYTDEFKHQIVSLANNGTKIDIIKANSEKYSINAMCKVLNITRSLVYYKNNLIDDLLHTFKIERSLSKKGCPYDNAVAEATLKITKTEFAFNKIFDNLEILKLELFDYVNWYNNERIHGSSGYLTPVQYKNLVSEKKLS